LISRRAPPATSPASSPPKGWGELGGAGGATSPGDLGGPRGTSGDLPPTWRLHDGRPATALDVRRLIRSAPRFRAAVANGSDPDDLQSEVWAKLLAFEAAAGKSAYDPKRASLSKYIWRVTWSVIDHAEERQRNLAKYEQLGKKDEEGAAVDAGVWAEGHVDVDLGDDERAALSEALGDDRHSEIARFLLSGRSVKEAKRVFPSRWHTEIDRLAGRVRQRLLESIRLQRLHNDNS
jgi:hypothetical protein